MNKSANRILMGTAAVAALGAAIRVAGAARSADAPMVFPMSSIKAPLRMDADSLAEAASTTIANDPFRLANEPADVRFDARADEGPARGMPAVALIRPTFVLKAIVGGPPWQALLDGIPGQPAGTIIRAGSVFDKITIRAIGPDTVLVQAPDTAWKLTLKRDRP